MKILVKNPKIFLGVIFLLIFCITLYLAFNSSFLTWISMTFILSVIFTYLAFNTEEKEQDELF